MRLLSLLTIAASLGTAGCGVSKLYAIHNGDIAEVKRFLDEGTPVDNTYDGMSYLSYAASHSNAETVKLLLERGADPFKKSRGRTPLQWAVELDRKENARILRDAEARSSAGLAAETPPPGKKVPVSDVDAPMGSAAQRPDDFALVIGVEDYQSLPKADYGVRDAKTVRRHLEALGFPPRNIISLEGPQATGNKLKSYLEEWLPLNVKETSTLFVYYSGHGAPDPRTGEAYLVPWDGDASFLKSTALPLTRLYADLSKTKAKRVIVALDACFSGAGGRSVLAKGARPLVARVADAAPTHGSITLLAAASGDEITGSLDEQGHGMFTYHLLKGLSADPKASAKSLFDYVTPRVQDDARRQNRVQTPVLAGAALNEPLLAP